MGPHEPDHSPGLSHQLRVDLRDRANWEAAIDWAIDKHEALRTGLQSIVGIDTTIR